uniref:JmjC domain-containing protein n=1 Tax=Spongospora subterranea TaxID=70186 RepID=A0A0H5QUE7_9EUKA|eukprot:CRZ05530.1 hypothetical protein [Spongospora subterranea]
MDYDKLLSVHLASVAGSDWAALVQKARTSRDSFLNIGDWNAETAATSSTPVIVRGCSEFFEVKRPLNVRAVAREIGNSKWSRGRLLYAHSEDLTPFITAPDGLPKLNLERPGFFSPPASEQLRIDVRGVAALSNLVQIVSHETRTNFVGVIQQEFFVHYGTCLTPIHADPGRVSCAIVPRPGLRCYKVWALWHHPSWSQRKLLFQFNGQKTVPSISAFVKLCLIPEVLVCIMAPGDVVVLPTRTSHAVLTVWPSEIPSGERWCMAGGHVFGTLADVTTSAKFVAAGNMAGGRRDVWSNPWEQLWRIYCQCGGPGSDLEDPVQRIKMLVGAPKRKAPGNKNRAANRVRALNLNKKV